MSRSCWQVVEDEPTDVHLVLFVRDTFGLASPVGAPGPLLPAVPDGSEQIAASIRSAAADAWPAWWQAVLDSRRDPERRQTTPSAEATLPVGGVDPPDFPSLTATAELRELARAAFRPFLQWWSPPMPAEPAPRRPGGPLGLPGARGRLIDLHLPRPTVQEAVASIESELQRPARPFELHIDIVAVAEPMVLLQDGSTAMISGELVGDEAQYRDWLRTLLRPLA